MRSLPLALVLGLLAVARPAPAAIGPIDTSHVSHVGWQDRRPLCPVDQEGFDVVLYTLAGNVASVRVRLAGDDGQWLDATRTGVRGAYDAWRAELPAAASPQVRYYFELADGAARAYLGPVGPGAAPPADSGWVVDFATLAHAPLGATPVSGGGVVFRTWAPDAGTAAVRGEFNGWGVTPMTRLGEDFVARVGNASPNQQYKYFFSNNWWSPDARGRVLDPASYYWNSRVADPGTYTWHDEGFRAPALERMVIYQLNVGTFAGLHDPQGATSFPSRFTDLAARARELRDLGVNAVLLNPVASAPTQQYAGYNTLDPWSIEWTFGMPDDFKSAVDALHRQGIAVLCDIVWNHVDPYTNLLWNYDGAQAYFESPASQTPWGPQAAFGRRGVDDYFVESALHWLEEYHVDGFRMDAVAYMTNAPHAEAGWALMQRLHAELERRWTGTVTIAENFPVQGQIVEPVAYDGAGFDATYNGDFRYFLRWAVPVNTSQYWSSSMFTFCEALPAGLTAGHQSFNYFQLHDDAWDNNGNHRFIHDLAPTAGVVADTARARMQVMLGALMLLPGVPGMLMGDEWAETAPWGVYAANRIDWGKRATNAGYYAFVRDLIALRTLTPALFADAPSIPTHYNYGAGVYGWVRRDAVGRQFLVIVNLGDEDFPSYLIGVPRAGAWTERLNSQAPAYGGTGLVNATPVVAFNLAQDGYGRAIDVAIPRSSVLVFQSLTTADVDDAPGARVASLDHVWPNPARGALRAEFTLPVAGDAEVAVFDAQGRRVATLSSGALAAGVHDLAWRGIGDDGAPVAAGLYFVRLRAGGVQATRRVALLR